MVTSKPSAAAVRRMARLCQVAAKDAGNGGIAQKFTALASDLEAKAAQVERDGGKGTA